MASYLDYIRRNRRGGSVIDGNEMIPVNQAMAYAKELGAARSGTNYFNPSRYGSDLSLRQLVNAKRNLDRAAAGDERFNQIAFRQAQNSGNASFGALAGNSGYGYGSNGLPKPQPPVFAAPSRQAIDSAVQANNNLNSPESKTVVSQEGNRLYKTVYGQNGTQRSALPQGTTVDTTDEGHSVLKFPNGLSQIVSAQGGQSRYFNAPAVQQSLQDFNSPALSTSTIKNLNSNYSAFDAVLAGNNGAAAPAASPVPAATPAATPTGEAPGYGFGQAVGTAVKNAAVYGGNALTQLRNNIVAPVYNVGAGALGTSPMTTRPYAPYVKPDEEQ